MTDFRMQWKDVTLAEAISERRSIRVFRPGRVDKETLRRLVQAALLAPSAHNAQPARFIVIETDLLKNKLLDHMERLWRDDLAGDRLDSEEIDRRVASAGKMIRDAPILILASYTLADMHQYDDSGRSHAEETMAIQSLAAAIQNLLLAAHAEGLGACWVCAPLFAKRAVRSVLGLDEALEPQAFILLGRPAENPDMPERKDLGEVLWSV